MALYVAASSTYYPAVFIFLLGFHISLVEWPGRKMCIVVVQYGNEGQKGHIKSTPLTLINMSLLYLLRSTLQRCVFLVSTTAIRITLVAVLYAMFHPFHKNLRRIHNHLVRNHFSNVLLYISTYSIAPCLTPLT